MATKISALPAASGVNVTDAAVGFPFVDSTVTTTRLTISQLRTQLSVGAQVFSSSVQAVSFVLAGGNFTSSSDNVGSVGTAGIRFADVRSVLGTFNTLTVSTGVFTVSAGAAILQTAVFNAAAVAGSAGTLTIGSTTQTTVGAAGAAAAIPVPLGYLVAYVAGVKVAIPYCNG